MSGRVKHSATKLARAAADAKFATLREVIKESNMKAPDRIWVFTSSRGPGGVGDWSGPAGWHSESDSVQPDEIPYRSEVSLLSDETVERAARAICAEEHADDSIWESRDEFQRDVYISAARAALEAAVKEPENEA